MFNTSREYSVLTVVVLGVVIGVALVVGPTLIHLFQQISGALALPVP